MYLCDLVKQRYNARTDIYPQIALWDMQTASLELEGVEAKGYHVQCPKKLLHYVLKSVTLCCTRDPIVIFRIIQWPLIMSIDLTNFHYNKVISDFLCILLFCIPDVTRFCYNKQISLVPRSLL